MSSLSITGGKVYTPNGEEDVSVYRENGKIVDALSTPADREIDATGLIVMPAFIDPHVHFREPGNPEKACMASEAKAARHAGITTVCDMPNTFPPPSTVEAFADKVERADKVGDCDIRFYFGVTQMEHTGNVRELLTNSEHADVLRRFVGVKLFLENSTGNLKIDPAVVPEVFSLAAELDFPVVAHCEDSAMNEKAWDKYCGPSSPLGVTQGVELHSLVRPPESEAASIAAAIDLSAKYGTRFHVAHLSTKQGLNLVRQAKADGLSVTCEVTPHHLFLSTEDYDSLGTLCKMNPPVRTPDHCEALWEGLLDGSIDIVATDHAPHQLSEKSCENKLEAPSGVPGVETSFALICNALLGTGEDIFRVYNLFFANANTIFRLGKDAIELGASPDIVLIDPNKEWEIHGEDLLAQQKWTPFEGWNMKGKVVDVL